MMAKAALVTGASSGIGRMVAQELKNAGFQVYAAARRVDRMADLEKDGITPLSATAKQPMKHPAYADFIGKPIVVGSKNSLVFSKEDALVPFISRNESMWEFFEPELRRRRLSMWQRSWATANARCSASCRRKIPASKSSSITHGSCWQRPTLPTPI